MSPLLTIYQLLKECGYEPRAMNKLHSTGLIYIGLSCINCIANIRLLKKLNITVNYESLSCGTKIAIFFVVFLVFNLWTDDLNCNLIFEGDKA